MSKPKLKKFIVTSWWYSQQEVEAYTREEAERLGVEETPYLDKVEVRKVNS